MGVKKKKKKAPHFLETLLPLIVFNQIHLSPFEIIASPPCLGLIFRDACALDVEVQRLPWVLGESNRTCVLCST